MDYDVDGKPLGDLEDVNYAIEIFKSMHLFVEMDFMTSKRYNNITVECDLEHCKRNFMLKNREMHF